MGVVLLKGAAKAPSFFCLQRSMVQLFEAGNLFDYQLRGGLDIVECMF